MTANITLNTNLLIAPPGKGKTTFCLQRIKSVIQQSPFAAIWIIVRDKLQADRIRSALVKNDITVGVEVATFSDLYLEVCQRAGLDIPVAEKTALSLIIKKTIGELASAGKLTYFQRIFELPGFANLLMDRFVELKSALVMPDQLERVARTQADPALIEIAQIFAAYQQRLQTLNWADSSGLSWLGLDALRSRPDLLHDWRLVIVDGFDSFSPAQLQTVQAIAAQVQEMWVTLPGDESLAGDDVRTAHRRFVKAFRELQTGMEFQIVSLSNPHHLPTEISVLEARLFEPPVEPIGTNQQVQMLEARSPQEEVREALRWLKMRIVRDGITPSGCALIIPEESAYRPALLAVAAEFGLSLQLSNGGRLIDTPPIAALAELLALPLRNFPSLAFLDTLRSPFFNLTAFGLHREDVRPLELVCQHSQIIEGLSQWRSALQFLSQSEEEAISADSAIAIADSQASDPNLEEEAGDEEAQTPPILPKGKQAVILLQNLENFSLRITPPAEEQSLSKWIDWLLDLLEELNYLACCTDGPESTWLAALGQQLTSLSVAERLAGQQPVAYPAFLTTLLGILAATGATYDLPGIAESIQVLHPFDARGLRFQAIAIVGLAEGIFPAIERSDPLLTESVRAELGMESQLSQDQTGIFYQLVTRADNRLLLTRPYLAEDGEGWEPSPFWNAVQEVLGCQVERVRPEDHRPLVDAASPEELMFWATRREELTGQGLSEPFTSEWQACYGALAHAHRVLSDRSVSVNQSPYSGHLGMLESSLRERFGRQATWSASRLEGYATCPFFFFAGATLGLKIIRPPKAGFETPQLGSLLHEVLERLYRDCPLPRTVNSLLARLPEVASQVFADAPIRYAFRPTLLWEIQQTELLETLRAAVVGLAELDGDAGWEPEAFESRFGIEGTPELWVQTAGDPVRLRGVIDRVDRDRHGNLRVIDYKSGGSHLAAQDLIDGRRLQLPLYALAVESALGMGHVSEGLYWKLFAQGAGALKLSRFQSDQGQGPDAAYAMAQHHVNRLVHGIRQGDFGPQPPDGGCPSYCPAASWCWSYKAKPNF